MKRLQISWMFGGYEKQMHLVIDHKKVMVMAVGRMVGNIVNCLRVCFNQQQIISRWRCIAGTLLYQEIALLLCWHNTPPASILKHEDYMPQYWGSSVLIFTLFAKR